MQNIAQVSASVKAALEAIGTYAEATALAAASSDGELLRYSRGLEEEMHVYWWVTGGWSNICEKPFRQLPLALAAVCAGQELVSKHSSAIGLFAAPALIDLLLERGRTYASDNVPFRDAATLPTLSWRKERFAGAAARPLAALMPVTTALGLAAASEDAGDWEPRFERLTGLKPDAALPAAELGLQLYRELLVARSLGG